MDSLGTEAKPPTIIECRRAVLPISEVLAQIGSKWTIYIIGSLSRGPRRFSELKREIDGISQKVLTSTLRDLEAGGLVTRTVTPSIPPRVDYELTELGLDLRQPLSAISAWAYANHERMAEARERFAERQAEHTRTGW